MCRHFGAEDHGSATIAGAREVLPTNVKPLHYDLTLETDFEKFTYEGTVGIEYVALPPLVG
jgi:aminopeptidase 2